MESLEAFEEEIKELIIELLSLEDITPEEIVSTESLFVEGLGLDSIDALEIAMGLEQRYGIVLSDDPDENADVFASVQNLALHVSKSRRK